jgi:hypothetical protein
VSSKWQLVEQALNDSAAAHSKGDYARAAFLARVAVRLVSRITPSAQRDAVAEHLSDLSAAFERAAAMEN